MSGVIDNEFDNIDNVTEQGVITLDNIEKIDKQLGALAKHMGIVLPRIARFNQVMK